MPFLMRLRIGSRTSKAIASLLIAVDSPPGITNASMVSRSAGVRKLSSLREDELYVAAKELQAPYELVKEVATNGKLPVVLFTAGGIARI